MNWFEIISGVISGGLLQYLISSKIMPKKEKKEADQVFIDTLLRRIDILEARIDNQSIMIKEMIAENERLKMEIKYLKGDDI